MKVGYYLGGNIAHFSAIYPFYKKLSGLVYCREEETFNILKAIYKDVMFTNSHRDLEKYLPDVVIYPDYHLFKGHWKNVQVFHGTSDKPYYFDSKNAENYDLCLTCGEWQEDKFKEKGIKITSKMIGYPKLDDVPNMPDIFPTGSPKLLYAPTWSVDSSLNQMDDLLQPYIDKGYSILIKPHPLAHLKTKKYKIIQMDNVLPLIKQADVVLCDRSAVSYEALGLGKEVIRTDGKEMEDVDYVFYKRDGKATERGVKAIKELVKNG